MLSKLSAKTALFANSLKLFDILDFITLCSWVVNINCVLIDNGICWSHIAAFDVKY